VEIEETNVSPRKLHSGEYTLYETTKFNERVPGMPWLRKSKRNLWPPCKQPNGRGKAFASYGDAVKFFIDNRPEGVKYGEKTQHMLERYIGN